MKDIFEQIGEMLLHAIPAIALITITLFIVHFVLGPWVGSIATWMFGH